MAYLGNAPGVESQRLTTTFTATDGQTAFNPVGGYTLGYVDAYLNGVKLIDGTDYTAADGVTVTLTSGAALNDNVELVTYTPRGLSDGYTKTEADAKYATISGFESTGIDDNATSTAITIDASENVGIGDTAPERKLHVNSGSTNECALFESTDTEVTVALKDSTGTAEIKARNDFRFSTGGTERARIDSSGNVGIGTASPSAYNVAGNSFVIEDDAAGMTLASSPTGSGHILFADSTSGSGAYAGFIRYDHTTDSMRFAVGAGAERARFDSNGNLLVGTTDAAAGVGNTNSGIILGSNNSSVFSRSGASGQPTMYINKNTNDGTLVQFNKDGATVGSIGANSGDIYIASSGTFSAGLMFEGSSGAQDIRPCSKTGSLLDAAIDLGDPSARFKDLYLSSSVQVSRASSGIVFSGSVAGTGKAVMSGFGASMSIGYGDITGLNMGSGQIVPVQGSGLGSGFDAAVDLGSTTARFKDLYLSGGVYLGGTGAANKLDDYEEGDWTGAIAGVTNLTGTASLGYTKYVKVGNQVHLYGHITGLSITNASTESSLVVTVPFNSATNTSPMGGSVFWSRGRSNGIVADNTGNNSTTCFIALPSQLCTDTGSTSITFSIYYQSA